jgi:serine/threonine-protein kinase HipA
MKKAKVYYSENLAGHLSETDGGYEFVYDESYLLDKQARPVSLTLPLRKEVYKSNVLFPFFDGLIPEGWLLNVAVDYWKVKSNDRFEILLATCADAIGAVSIIPE